MTAQPLTTTNTGDRFIRITQEVLRRANAAPPVWRRLRYPSLWQLVSLAVAGIVALPIGYLIMRALSAGSEGLAYLLQARTLTIVSNSLTLTVGVVLSAVLIGVPFAWLTARTDLPYRRAWLVLGMLTVVIPSYLGALTYIEAFGPKGILQSWLEPFGVQRLPDIRGYWGAWLSITLFTYPYVVLPVRAALLNSDPALEDVGRSMGFSRWRVFWHITLPQLRPAIAVGALMTALYTLSDFGAIAVMRFNAFTRAIYTQYSGAFNLERAAMLALVLIVLTLGLLAIEQHYNKLSANYRVGTGARRHPPIVALGAWKGVALAFCALPVFVGVVIPLSVVFYWFWQRGMVEAADVSMPVLTQNTLLVSLAAAGLAAFIAVPMGVLGARSRARGDQWLVRFAYLGNVLPGVVVGLAWVFFASQAMPALYQTLPLLIVGYLTRYLPYSIGTTRSALTQLNPHYEESARLLGLNKHQVLLRVTLPLARAGILAGAALVFLNVMKELPTTLILAPIGFRTLATRIWSVQAEGLFVLLGEPSLLLMLASALGLGLMLWRDDRLK